MTLPRQHWQCMAPGVQARWALPHVRIGRTASGARYCAEGAACDCAGLVPGMSPITGKWAGRTKCDVIFINGVVRNAGLSLTAMLLQMQHFFPTNSPPS